MEMKVNRKNCVSVNDWERRKAFINFSENDIKLLKELRPHADTFVDNVVEQLYEQFLRFKETRRFLSDDKVLKRLKGLQRGYFLQLFDGDYGPEYLESRLKVGQVHHVIGLSPQWYMGAYAIYTDLVMPHIFEIFQPDVDKARKAIAALEKLKHLDQDLAITTYIAAREEVIEEQTREIIELATPIVQLWEGVIAATLIGTLDSQRAQYFIERLLERIVHTQSKAALIDITGVPAIDSATAQYLIASIKY